MKLEEYLKEKGVYEKYIENKNYLKSISFASLPSKPSQYGFSADDIKRKSYEPVLQIFDWLYELEGTVNSLVTNQSKLFVVNLSSVLILNLANNDFHYSIIDQVLTTEELNTFINFNYCEVIKELLININGGNKSYIFMLNKGIKKDNLIEINGIGYNTENNYISSVYIQIDINQQILNSRINDLTLTIQQIEAEVKELKNELLAKCVPKQDIQTISQIGEDKPMTEGGFIQIKTYEETDYTYKGGN